MKNDLISIIIPVYNVENYLSRCLDSVINQTYKNLEIILIDDGSTDNSGVICDVYANKDKRISVIHQKNAGQASARNIGINKAKGIYLTFIDSDDYITLDYIEYLYKLICKYDADMSICSYKIITTNKKINYGSNYLEKKYDIATCLKDMLLSKNLTVSPCMKLYKKELIKDILFPTGKICEDNGTTYKFIMASKRIIFGSKPNYYYYRRVGSTMNQVFNKKYFDILEMTDMMSNDLKNNYPNIIDAINYKNMEVRFTVLRKIAECKNNSIYSKEVSRLKEEIINYYKAINDKSILSLKDKVGYYSLKISFKTFSLFWKTYKKIKYSD